MLRVTVIMLVNIVMYCFVGLLAIAAGLRADEHRAETELLVRVSKLSCVHTVQIAPRVVNELADTAEIYTSRRRLHVHTYITLIKLGVSAALASPCLCNSK